MDNYSILPLNEKRKDMILLIVLIVAGFIVFCCSESPRHRPSVSTHEPETLHEVPAPIVEEEEKPLPPQKSVKEILEEIHETRASDHWYEDVKKKYPLTILPNGEPGIRILGEDGHYYSTHCYKNPTSTEYMLAVYNINWKQKNGMYDR